MKLRHHALTLALLVTSLSAEAGDGPTYSDKKAQRAVERMVKAHGGLEAWRKLPSIAYEHEMLDPNQPSDPWLSREVHDPRSRLTYHEWPKDEAQVGYDGEHVWSLGWKRQNPPSMMAGVSFFFLNLPFITQDQSARIEWVGKKKVEHVASGKSVTVVRLTFEGASEHEYYELHIDPRSNLLVGVEYTVVNEALFRLFGVPPETKFMGPLLKVYMKHEEVAGLTLPTRYDTILGGRKYGMHWARDYTVDRPFDTDKARAPEGARVERESGIGH